MVSGGLPCPRYSVAGRQLGRLDDRDLPGHGLRIVEEVHPQAVMLENVKGILEPRSKWSATILLAVSGSSAAPSTGAC